MRGGGGGGCKRYSGNAQIDQETSSVGLPSGGSAEVEGCAGMPPVSIPLTDFVKSSNIFTKTPPVLGQEPVKGNWRRLSD